MLPAILLMGPTASGKSALALAIAERYGGEILSVDSAQVYRDMDIGSAKPDAATRARVPHHLIDAIDPTESYSAARFVSDARGVLAEIRARARLPILSGGTMLYFKALSEGLSDLPGADPALRARLDQRAASEGWPTLHAELARVDPQTASRLKRSDAQRIQRALEVWHCAGVPLSSLQGRRHAGGWLGPQLALALLPSDRSRLHETIARRFDAMLAAGLVDELRTLRRRYRLTADLPSMRCIGYRQAWQFLEAEIDAPALRARGIAATRQLAKRQFTWLRGTAAEAVDPYSASAFESIAEKIDRALAHGV